METAIYGRVSTEEQALEGYSIRGQVEKLKSYVSAKSWSIYDVYLDEGISGKNMTERPAINRMMEDIKAGYVKNVLVFKLDRLTRSVADLVYLIDLFKKYGCAFNSLSESIDTSTASGRMFIKIIGIFAEFERENIGERVRLGKERKAKEGYTVAGGKISYGYERNNGEKVQRIKENEAAVVRRIFDMYVNQNISLNGIAKTLNMEGIPSQQGHIWNTGVIINLVKNCNYIGKVRYATEHPERYFEAEGRHEAIISAELFNEAQIIMEKNRAATPTKKPVEKNYFSGLLYCSLCGRKMMSHFNYDRKKTLYYNFYCNGQTLKVCTAKKLSAKNVEIAVKEYFNNIPVIEENAEKEERAKKETAARIETLKGKLTAFENKEKETLDLYIEDTVTLAEYRAIKTQLDGERAKILIEIEELTPNKKITVEPHTRDEIVSSFNKDWNNFTDIQKRQFLLKYIRKITLENKPVKGSVFGKIEISDIEFNAQ